MIVSAKAKFSVAPKGKRQPMKMMKNPLPNVNMVVMLPSLHV